MVSLAVTSDGFKAKRLRVTSFMEEAPWWFREVKSDGYLWRGLHSLGVSEDCILNVVFFFYSVQDIRQVKYTFCTTFESKRYTNHLHAFSLGYWYKTYAKSSAPFVQLSRVSGTPSIYMHLVLGIASAWCCSKPPASSRMRTFLHATDKVYIVYHQAVPLIQYRSHSCDDTASCEEFGRKLC